MEKFLNLGSQPLANSYIKKNNLKLKEKKFKLQVGFNKKNYLVSIINTVPKEKMFNNEYPYKSSESKTMRKSFKDLAKKIKKKYKPNFIIEIGSNDGAFLKNFANNHNLNLSTIPKFDYNSKKTDYENLEYKNIAKFYNPYDMMLYNAAQKEIFNLNK